MVERDRIGFERRLISSTWLNRRAAPLLHPFVDVWCPPHSHPASNHDQRLRKRVVSSLPYGDRVRLDLVSCGEFCDAGKHRS